MEFLEQQALSDLLSTLEKNCNAKCVDSSTVVTPLRGEKAEAISICTVSTDCALANIMQESVKSTITFQQSSDTTAATALTGDLDWQSLTADTDPVSSLTNQLTTLTESECGTSTALAPDISTLEYAKTSNSLGRYVLLDNTGRDYATCTLTNLSKVVAYNASQSDTGNQSDVGVYSIILAAVIVILIITGIIFLLLLTGGVFGTVVAGGTQTARFEKRGDEL